MNSQLDNEVWAQAIYNEYDCSSVEESGDLEAGASEGLVASQIQSTASTSVNQSQTGPPSKKRKQQSSWIWDHFDREENNKVSICLHCLQKNTNRTYPFATGNSTLAKHLSKEHAIKKGQTVGVRVGGGQDESGVEGEVAFHALMDENTQADIRKSLVEFIIDNKQSFALVESLSFQRFVAKLNRRFKVPS